MKIREHSSHERKIFTAETKWKMTIAESHKFKWKTNSKHSTVGTPPTTGTLNSCVNCSYPSESFHSIGQHPIIIMPYVYRPDLLGNFVAAVSFAFQRHTINAFVLIFRPGFFLLFIILMFVSRMQHSWQDREFITLFPDDSQIREEKKSIHTQKRWAENNLPRENRNETEMPVI